ncbi:MAG: hypothetical protein U9O20_00045 [Patescibacteria group bacterium]|nr:hypothetical protein [Patescibacteria group bacterium]
MNDSYANYSYNKDTKEYIKDDKHRKLVYVNLQEESLEEGRFVNIAIRKIKIEEDFISYTLTSFIEAMFDFGLISLEEYNLYIYGTEDLKEIALTQTGLGMNLISRLKQVGQLDNLEPDDFGNLKANEKFIKYKESLDDFYRFEIDRYL